MKTRQRIVHLLFIIGMSTTTHADPHPSFGLFVHHTDEEREFAYGANPTSRGTLTTALGAAAQYCWTVVDMKADWATIFSAPE